MRKSKTLVSSLAAIAVGALALAGCASSSDSSEGGESSGSATTVSFGVAPWIGYSPVFIADENDYFADEGLDVTLEMFNNDRDKAAAFISGQLDVTTVASQTALQLAEQDVDFSIFYLLDTSLEADAVLSGSDIAEFSDLKGKQVAWEEGSPSDLLIHWALRDNGMTIDDIEKVPMDANAAGTALVSSDQIAAAGTYEPYITEVMSQDGDIKKLVTAAEAPGIISDPILVMNDYAAENPETLEAIVRAVAAGADFYNESPDEAHQIVADALEVPVDDLKTSFAGVEIYNLEDNVGFFDGAFAQDGLPLVQQAAADAGLIEGTFTDFDSILDGTFVNAVANG